MERKPHKVVVVGPQGAGKTSLVNALLYGRMDWPNGTQAMSTKISTKTVVSEDAEVILQIWDWVGGTKHFARLARTGFLTMAEAAILAYDCSPQGRRSVGDARDIYDAIKATPTLRYLWLVGCRSDLGADDDVEASARELYKYVQAGPMTKTFKVSVSAKNGTGMAGLVRCIAACLSGRDCDSGSY
ncbi:MAG: GTPase domain-containing protein [Candidatus Thorarchaeota archaeon]|nr:GTPase domain-containing protein [Candidatus Thorarchaeota archaeon]